MNSFNRRKFLITAGMVASSSIFLKGCLGNPPEPQGNSGTTTTATTQATNLTPETTPETTKVKLGFMPIFEAAPLIIA